MRVRSVGSVVDDTDVERSIVEVDNSGFGDLLIVGGFGDSTKIGTGFHFDNSDIVFGIFFNKVFIFQESAENGNSFLIGKN